VATDEPTDRPSAMTVLGAVPVAELGVVLPHEHLLIRLRPFIDPSNPDLAERVGEPLSMDNLGWVRQYWTYNADNMRLDDEELAITEAARFVAAGGSTLVDLTLPGVGRDPAALARIARATGLNIVAGCGAYVDWLKTPEQREASVDALAEAWLIEIKDGIDGTSVRPGIIGEIGCSWPLEPSEERALRAAAIVQRATGLSISLHPGRNRAAPAQLLALLGEAGADLRRVVIGHVERTVQQVDALIALAASGVYIEIDCFGLETSFFPVPGIDDIDMPNDAQRLAFVRALIDAGFGGQVLLSQDICTKHRLARYGGHGYDHLLANVRPWMVRRGFTDSEVRMLLEANPAELLAISPDRGQAQSR
jgi:phosphotriesterase-related protein